MQGLFWSVCPFLILLSSLSRTTAQPMLGVCSINGSNSYQSRSKKIVSQFVFIASHSLNR